MYEGKLDRAAKAVQFTITAVMLRYLEIVCGGMFVVGFPQE